MSHGKHYMPYIKINPTLQYSCSSPFTLVLSLFPRSTPKCKCLAACL